MGADRPQGSMAGLPDNILPQTKTSGGDQPFIVEPDIKVPDKSGIGDALMGLGQNLGAVGRQFAQAAEEQQKEAERKIREFRAQQKELADKDRALQLSSLSSNLVVEESKQQNEFDRTYQGDPAQYESEWNKGWDERQTNYRKEIQDPELLRQYDIVSNQTKVKFQLNAMDKQQTLYESGFKAKLTTSLKGLDDELRARPTPDNYQTVMGKLELLKGALTAGASKDVQANAETLIAAAKERLTEFYVNEQSANGVPGKPLESLEMAMDTIKDPTVNENLPVESQTTLNTRYTNQYNSILEDQRRMSAQQAKLLFPSYMKAKLEGLDTAEIEGQLKTLAPFLTPEDQIQFGVIQEVMPQYKEFMDQLPNMKEADRRDLLEQLDPSKHMKAADASYAVRSQIYSDFLTLVDKKVAEQKTHPISAEQLKGGQIDRETAIRQYLGRESQKGTAYTNMKVMDDDEVQPHLDKLQNLVAAGDFAGVVQFFNQDILGQFGPDAQHQYRQVAPNVTWATIAINQLRNASKDPLSKRMLAALLIAAPTGGINQTNSFLLRAAFIPPDKRGSFYADRGIKEDDIRGALMANKTYMRFFNPQNPSVDLQNLMADQKQLFTDAVLLQIPATGKDDRPGGVNIGPLHVGGQSQIDYAVSSVIKDYIPYKAVEVTGGHHKGELDQGVLNAAPGLAAKSGISAIEQHKKLANESIHIDSGDILVPNQYDGKFGPDTIKEFLSQKLSDQQWVHDHIVLMPKGQQITGFAGNFSMAAPQQKSTAIYQKVIAPVEGGYNPNDNGSPTMRGLRWVNNVGRYAQIAGITDPKDIQKLTKEQANQMAYVGYFLPSKAGEVKDPKLAAFLYDTYFQGPAVHREMLKAVPEFERVKDLAPTGANIAQLDAVFNKMVEFRLAHVSTTSRVKAVAKAAESLRQELGGPTTPAMVPKGHKILQDQAMKMLKKGLVLTNTEDLNGIRINQQSNATYGQVGPQPFLKSDGQPLQFSYDEIWKWTAQNHFKGRTARF